MQSTTYILVISFPKSSLFFTVEESVAYLKKKKSSHGRLRLSSLSYCHSSNPSRFSEPGSNTRFPHPGAVRAKGRVPGSYPSSSSSTVRTRACIHPEGLGCPLGKEGVVTAPGQPGCFMMAVTLRQPSYHSLSVSPPQPSTPTLGMAIKARIRKGPARRRALR